MNINTIYYNEDLTILSQTVQPIRAYAEQANTIEVYAPVSGHNIGFFILQGLKSGVPNPRLIPTERLTMYDVGNVTVGGVLYYHYNAIIPGAVLNDMSLMLSTGIRFQAEFWFVGDTSLGVRKYDTEVPATIAGYLATDFPAAVSGDTVRVIDTDTDWDFDGTDWVDFESQHLTAVSKEPTSVADFSLERGISTTDPTHAPSNTELILQEIRNNKTALEGSKVNVSAVVGTTSEIAGGVDADTEIYTKSKTTELLAANSAADQAYTDAEIVHLTDGTITVNKATNDPNGDPITTTYLKVSAYNADVSKLAGIEAGAEVNIIEGVIVDGTTLTPDVDRKVTIPSADASTQNGLLTHEDKAKLDGIEASADVNVIEGVVVDGLTLTLDANKNVTIPVATNSTDGLMTAEEKQQVAKIATLEGAWVYRGLINKTTAEITATPALLSARMEELLDRTPQLGDVLVDTSKNEWYFDGTNWINMGETTIALANATDTDGLMSHEDKAILDGIEHGAQVNVIESVVVNGSALGITSKSVTIPVAVPTGEGETDGLMSHQDKATLDGLVSTGGQANVIEGVIVDGTTLTPDGDKKVTIPSVNSTTQDGLMTHEDKSILDGLGTSILGKQVYHGIELAGAISVARTGAEAPYTFTFTIASGTNTYWYKGVKYTTASAITCNIATAFGGALTANTLYWIYFADATGALSVATTMNLKEHVPVATVYTNYAVDAVMLHNEKHNHTRDIDWHINAHLTIGTRYYNGLDNVKPSTTYDDTLEISMGIVYDEDISVTIGSGGSPITAARILYQRASGVYEFIDGLKLFAGATVPRYLNTGTYALTDVGNNNYSAYFVYATTDVDSPIYIIPYQGASVSSDIATARGYQPPILVGITNAIAPEMKLIYKYIYRGNGDFRELADYRNASSLPSGQVSQPTAAGTSFASTPTIPATNVQYAIELAATPSISVTKDADYTLGTDGLIDGTKTILAGHATNAVKITIPLDSTTDFPIGTEISIMRYLAGVVTFGTADGATLNGEAYTTVYTIADRWETVTLKKVAADTWVFGVNRSPIETISIGGTALTITAKDVAIPEASTSVHGVVQLSNATDVASLTDVDDVVTEHILKDVVDSLLGSVQITSSFTLEAQHAGILIIANHATTPISISIPLHATVPCPPNTEIAFTRYGAAVVGIEGVAGVTLNGVSGGGVTITNQYGSCVIKQILADDNWVVVGGVTVA